jgi:hypothetical protein
MTRLILACLPSLLTLACAHAGRGPSGEVVLERGGELADAEAERETVKVTPSTITVWGMTEVPDGSRRQTALAGVDAIARAELLKVVEVRVAEVVTDVDSTDPRRRSITMDTMEAVHGVVASVGPLPHGWARVRRGGEIVLRLWARLEVPRAALDTACRSLLESRGKVYSPSLFDRLGQPDSRQGSRP